MAAKACILHCVNHEDSEYGCKIEPCKQYKGRITEKPENCPYFKEKKQVCPKIQEEKAMIDKKAEKRGRTFAPYITYAVAKNKESGKWLASVCIDECYYETDPYKTKEGALSELLGCINALGGKCQEIEDLINDEIYGRKNS